MLNNTSASNNYVYSIITHLVDLGIPHQLLHRVFAIEPIASKYLNSVSGHLIGDVSSEGLGDGGIVGVSAALVHLPG